MRGRSRNVETVMAELARRSHGVGTRGELLRAGIRSNGIDREAKKGALIRVHPGVYWVGHAAPSVDASFMAAVKACGKEAKLGGRAAAYLLGLIRGQPPKPEVFTPKERRVKGIKTRRAQ